jgi:hypothetical protein
MVVDRAKIERLEKELEEAKRGFGGRMQSVTGFSCGRCQKRTRNGSSVI